MAVGAEGKATSIEQKLSSSVDTVVILQADIYNGRLRSECVRQERKLLKNNISAKERRTCALPGSEVKTKCIQDSIRPDCSQSPFESD